MIQGKSVLEPTLYTLLQNLKTDISKSLNCAKPGIIQSFDSALRTAVVQIVFKRVLQDGTTVSYPILVDCPVVTLQGGGGALTFPISAGDECLVLFADANIDAWFLNGGQAAPYDERRHDLSDGMAIVGLNSQANPLTVTLVAGEAAFAFGGAKVGMLAGKVTVANQTKSLAIILTQLVTTLTAMTTASIASGATQTALTPIIADLAALLY